MSTNKTVGLIALSRVKKLEKTKVFGVDEILKKLIKQSLWNFFLLKKFIHPLSYIILLGKCSYTQKTAHIENLDTFHELSAFVSVWSLYLTLFWTDGPKGTPFDLVIFQDHAYIKIKILYSVKSHFYWALLLTVPMWHMIPPQRAESSGMRKEILARGGTYRCSWSSSLDVGSGMESAIH